MLRVSLAVKRRLACGPACRISPRGQPAGQPAGSACGASLLVSLLVSPRGQPAGSACGVSLRVSLRVSPPGPLVGAGQRSRRPRRDLEDVVSVRRGGIASGDAGTSESGSLFPSAGQTRGVESILSTVPWIISPPIRSWAPQMSSAVS